MTAYLDWESELTLQQVFAASDPFSYPSFSSPYDSDSSSNKGDSKLAYLTHLTQDNGRAALMLEGSEASMTPTSFNLRTKISEYGGKPYCWSGKDVIFANQSDQCLYRQSVIEGVNGGVTSEPVRISPISDAQTLMYSDVWTLTDSVVLAVVERQTEGAENQSSIAWINPNQPDHEPQVLVSGADFYSNLVIDTKTKRIAWVQWNHPGMPWDKNQVWVAEYVCNDSDVKEPCLQIEREHQVELDQTACACQLMFANNGRLFFSADFAGAPADSENNFWNIFAYSCIEKSLMPVTKLQYEFGYPHWVYGDSRIAQYDPNTLLTIASTVAGDVLYAIDQDFLEVSTVNGFGLENSHTLKGLVADGQGKAAVMVMQSDQNPSLIQLHGAIQSLIIRTIVDSTAYEGSTSIAQHFAFATRDGEQAFGFYYPPVNANYECEGPPPLIVMVHGGPTSRAYGYFDIQKQFWTSRGFALFDVNHRGSSGYGREYRDALYDRWGEIDATDIVDGVQFLIEQGQADASKICIRGKSAGGYAVLRALTEYPEIFKAGACYYGIGNLATLAGVTHKFEKFYTDRLIGEQYDPVLAQGTDSLYYQRSPINKVANLQSAMIVFQGLQDKVVPPELAQEMVAALKAAKLEYSYVEYADEGHGFRQAANNIDAWGKELAFYKKVLS